MSTLIKPVEELPVYSEKLDDFYPVESTGINVPPSSILKADNSYSVTMAIPGLQEENIWVDIIGNILTISAGSLPGADEQADARKQSCFFFSQRFTIPGNIDKSKIDTQFNNGNLVVILPVQ